MKSGASTDSFDSAFADLIQSHQTIVDIHAGIYTLRKRGRTTKKCDPRQSAPLAEMLACIEEALHARRVACSRLAAIPSRTIEDVAKKLALASTLIRFNPDAPIESAPAELLQSATDDALRLAGIDPRQFKFALSKDAAEFLASIRRAA